jgi:hypothetical protein
MVTHDNRILDVADRLMYLEDGRLSSFAPVTSPHAAHLLTALRPLASQGLVGGLLARMHEAEFLDLLRALAAESEQFLNVLDLGSSIETHTLFRETAHAVLAHVVSQSGASAGRVWARDPADEEAARDARCILGYPDIAGHPGAEVLECINSGAVRHSGRVLCIPLQGREMEVFAAVEMTGDRFHDSAEHSFRDFARPLGLLAQVCGRFEHYA